MPTDLTENVIRDFALTRGLIDVRVCVEAFGLYPRQGLDLCNLRRNAVTAAAG